jgi:WD40 repeat protein
MKIVRIFIWIIFFTAISENTLFAQSKDCNGQYLCWLKNAKEALANNQFIDAANFFAAAQACENAPFPDTLNKWIQQSYEENIAFIEKQKKEVIKEKNQTALRIKEAKNQIMASNITEDFAHIMQQEDITMQALLLQYACLKTDNLNKLAMRARREILSNPENIFYKVPKDVTVNFLSGNANLFENANLTKFNTLISKDGYTMVEVNEAGIRINHLFTGFPQRLPPIVEAKLSPNARYLYIQTLEAEMPKVKYIASKSIDRKFNYGIWDLTNFKWIQDLTSIENINTIAFSQSSDSLIMIQNNNQIIVKNLKNKATTYKNILKIPDGKQITNLLMTYSDQKMLMGFKDGSVVLCDSKGKILKAMTIFHHQQISDWDITKNDKCVISGSIDSTVWVWQLDNKSPKNGQHQFKNIVTSVAFSPDDSFCIASSLDKSAIIMDKNGKDVLQIRGSNTPILKCGFASEGRTIYTLEFLKMKTYNFQTTNYEIAGLDVWDDNMPQRWKGDMLFSKNKKYKIFKNTEGVSRLVEIDKGEILTFEGLTTYLFSPDDKYILTVKMDSVFAWDLQKKEVLWKLKSKIQITNAFFSEGKFDNYLMLANEKNNTAELWDLNKSTFAPLASFTENFISPKFIDNSSLLVNTKKYINSEVKALEIRKTNDSRTPIATLNQADIVFHFNEKDARLYALYESDIETEDNLLETKYALFEINLDKEKNQKLQPSLHFEVPSSAIIGQQFSASGDSILFKMKDNVLIFPNAIKLMNEERYLPDTILDITAKLNYQILSVEDCTEQENLSDMTQCALFFAEEAIKDPDYFPQFNQIVEVINSSKIKKTKLSENNKKIWTAFDSTLVEIVKKYPYESHYKEKIAITKQIIEIKESILGDTSSTDLGDQYSNLCWFTLFEDSLNKFKKSLIYGKKALKLHNVDWIHANLGHAYLFNNDYDSALKSYSSFFDRLSELDKDFDILEKADITHPRMTEMRKTLSEMLNKPSKY